MLLKALTQAVRAANIEMLVAFAEKVDTSQRELRRQRAKPERNTSHESFKGGMKRLYVLSEVLVHGFLVRYRCALRPDDYKSSISFNTSPVEYAPSMRFVSNTIM